MTKKKIKTILGVFLTHFVCQAISNGLIVLVRYSRSDTPLIDLIVAQSQFFIGFVIGGSVLTLLLLADNKRKEKKRRKLMLDRFEESERRKLLLHIRRYRE